MSEMILPGVYIDVRPEGLIVPGQVTVGNIGIVGTASKGPISTLLKPQPVLLGSYTDAVQNFGNYDRWIDGNSNELTLVRALELAYNQGATTVYAVRVAGSTAASSNTTLSSGDPTPQPVVKLTAKTAGSWGNSLAYNVWDADQDAIVENETHTITSSTPTPIKISLLHTPVTKNASNRILLNKRVLNLTYDDGSVTPPAPPLSGGVRVTLSNGALAFPPGEDPKVGDTVTATYAVDKSKALKVTLRLGQALEVYTVVDGNDLITDIEDRIKGSAWVDATALANVNELPGKSINKDVFTPFFGGDDGASGADYEAGLGALLNQNAHIIIAAGQGEDFGNTLDAHCQVASTDAVQHDRIAVVGSKLGDTLADITGHNINSDRVIFVVPGIVATDNAATPPVDVTLPGAYAAAAIAGLLSSFAPHISLTNKVLPVNGLEQQYSRAELTQILQARVLALEVHLGFHIVRGITTSTNTAWTQITTRRIVDYAKFGVRSAADPYIGLLNNERVRGALRSTINSFLAQMVNDEMLISYDLDVSASRDQQIRGIVQVIMVLRPVFSIDFIQVTMFLE